MILSYGRNMNGGELDIKNVLLFNVDFKMCVYICYKIGVGCWIYVVGIKLIRILIYINDWDKF